MSPSSPLCESFESIVSSQPKEPESIDQPSKPTKHAKQSDGHDELSDASMMMDARTMTYEQWGLWTKANGIPSFRSGQLFGWLHKHTVTSFDQMTNIPKALRQTVASSFCLPQTTVVLPNLDTDPIDATTTTKFLLQLDDTTCVECVWLPYQHGNTICVSTQVGCRMGCRFCASGYEGLVRQLTPAEIIRQVYTVQRVMGRPCTHVVYMGSGEPLDNIDNVVGSIHLLHEEHGQNISMRHITVSTCGIPPAIHALARHHLPITLALSLHAPTDEKRKEIMPIAYQYTIKQTLNACDDYANTTHRRITYEYMLIDGFNDGTTDAHMLADLLRGRLCHVNLIPYNPVEGKPYKASTNASCKAFVIALERQGIEVTLRRSMGQQDNAACGQLRHKVLHP